MKVINIHKREFIQSKIKILDLFSTLSTKEDKIWPNEKWPPMRLKEGFKLNSEGGHGLIRYKIIKYDPNNFVEFEFQKPKGFFGIHKFEIIETNKTKVEVKHTIDMETKGLGTLSWIFVIRWLHDALLQDAFDKLENQLFNTSKKTEWSVWVKILRAILKPKK